MRALLLLIPTLLTAQDLAIHNGKIVTADPAMTIHEAVLIRDGRVQAVGDSKSIVAKAEAAAIPMLDLEGRMALPGLVDNHVHALWAGLSEYREPLPPLNSFSAVRDYIRARAKKTPAGEWIVVPRTFPTRLEEMKMPTRDVLDVARKHPVLFDASYVVAVNSKALEMLSITRATPDPPGGEIVHAADGEPNGILKNAESLLRGVEQEAGFSDDDKLNALEAMLDRYVDAGLTAVGDRAADAEQIALYRRLHAAGRLPLRVVITWLPGANKPFEEIVRDIKTAGFTTGDGDDWLRFGAYKVTLDGGMTIGTAFQRRPYGEFGRQVYGMTKSDDVGMRFVGPEKLLAIFRAARDRGWQVTAHAQGGGAVDTFLRVMDQLNEERPIGKERHHLMHASFQSLEAIEKAAELGVLADVQAPWLYYDGPALEKVMGHEGMEMFFPLRSYIDAGVRIGGGSDHMIGFSKDTAVNPYNPFLQMWFSISRSRRSGEPLYPEQRITRAEALRMHTTWAAYLQFADDARGSIEVGKLADLTVIDRDFFECPEDEIREIQPTMTIIEGRIR